MTVSLANCHLSCRYWLDRIYGSISDINFDGCLFDWHPFYIVTQENLIPEGHRVLIFSQTRKMLNLIQVLLLTLPSNVFSEIWSILYMLRMEFSGFSYLQRL